jgi:hypothetical protein
MFNVRQMMDMAVKMMTTTAFNLLEAKALHDLHTCKSLAYLIYSINQVYTSYLSWISARLLNPLYMFGKYHRYVNFWGSQMSLSPACCWSIFNVHGRGQTWSGAEGKASGRRAELGQGEFWERV